MTAWWDDTYLAFDTETTGIDVRQDRIVTASLVGSAPGSRPRIETHLIAVEVEIPAEATAVHGITTEHAREHGQPAAEVLDVVAADLALAMVRGTPVIGFNCAFDFTMLENELKRNQLPTLHDRLDGRIRPVVDAFCLDKQDAPYRKGSRNLTAVCQHRGVLLGGAHEASADALAAARLAAVIVRGNREMAAMTLAELHDAQVVWRRQQCASLEAYFRRNPTRKAEVVDRCWPVCSGHDETAVA